VTFCWSQNRYEKRLNVISSKILWPTKSHKNFWEFSKIWHLNIFHIYFVTNKKSQKKPNPSFLRISVTNKKSQRLHFTVNVISFWKIQHYLYTHNFFFKSKITRKKSQILFRRRYEFYHSERINSITFC